MSNDNVVQIPLIQITKQRALEDGSTVSFQTYAAQDEPKEKLDALMDKLTEVSDRQQLHATLAREEQLLYNASAELERMEEGMKKADERVASLAREHLGSGRRGDFTLPAGEAKAREGLKTNLEMLTQKRDQIASRVDELRTILGKQAFLKAAE